MSRQISFVIIFAVLRRNCRLHFGWCIILSFANATALSFAMETNEKSLNTRLQRKRHCNLVHCLQCGYRFKSRTRLAKHAFKCAKAYEIAKAFRLLCELTMLTTLKSQESANSANLSLGPSSFASPPSCFPPEPIHLARQIDHLERQFKLLDENEGQDLPPFSRNCDQQQLDPLHFSDHSTHSLLKEHQDSINT
jgi:hypothetical protein